jgi:FAD dependent oxidoreductase
MIDSTTARASLPTPSSTASFWHREPSRLLLGHRSTCELPRSADVVVVGSGIAGAFAAWCLLAETETETEMGMGKRSVVMMEAREACWGATGRVG